MYNQPFHMEPVQAVPPAHKPRRETVNQSSRYGGLGGVLLLWIAFGALVAFWPATLTDIWDQYLDWNLIVQVVVGVLLLPWVVATWVWQSDWSTVARAFVIGFLVLGTIITFAPRSSR